MYRTYRNLYRIRPAITSIGQGKHRIRLPKGFQITLDMFLLTLVLLLPASLLAKLFLGNLIPLPSVLSGLILAGGVSMKLEKLDPSGKTLVSFLADVVKFVFRKKFSDGFETQRKMESFKTETTKVEVGLIEDGYVGSLPATGDGVKDFTLYGDFDVKLDKDGRLTVGYKLNRAKSLSKGKYSIRNNQLFPYKPPPKLFKNTHG